MNRNGPEGAAAAAALFVIALFVAGIALCAGWIMNIVDILTVAYDLPVFIVRIIGIFIPIIGGIAGWF